MWEVRAVKVLASSGFMGGNSARKQSRPFVWKKGEDNRNNLDNFSLCLSAKNCKSCFWIFVNSVPKMNIRPPLNFENSARENFWLKISEFWEVLLSGWKINACAKFSEKRPRTAEKSQRQIFKRRWLLKIWRAYRRGSRGKKMPQKCPKIAQNGVWCAKINLF